MHYVYKLYDTKGSLIYIGESKCVRKRVATHKGRFILGKCTYTVLSNKEEAMCVESYLITKLKPSYNKKVIYKLVEDGDLLCRKNNYTFVDLNLGTVPTYLPKNNKDLHNILDVCVRSLKEGVDCSDLSFCLIKTHSSYKTGLTYTHFVLRERELSLQVYKYPLGYYFILGGKDNVYKSRVQKVLSLEFKGKINTQSKFISDSHDNILRRKLSILDY